MNGIFGCGVMGVMDETREGGWTQYTPLLPSFIYTMDLASALIESQARERALMVELEAAKIARVEAEGAKKEAVAEKEALTLLAESLRGEKDLLKREVETLRATTGSIDQIIQRAAEAQYRQEQRSIWLRSPEAVLSLLCITAQNGYCA
jgi:hypothetical protein